MGERGLSVGRFSRFLIVPALLVVTAVTLAACGVAGTGGGGDEEAADGKVKEVNIGVVMPLTGANAQNGENSERGIRLAAEMINENGGIKSMGGAKIKLSVADSTSDPTRAASATQQFLSSGEKPIAVIGAYASGLTKTVTQVTQRAQVPLLTSGFSDELTSGGNQYIFRTAPKATDVGDAQFEYAAEMAQEVEAPFERVAITFTNDEYGSTQAEGVREAAEEAGVEVALFEPYEANITNATSLARKISGANPDVIFAVSYLTDGTQLVRALTVGGNDAPLVGGVGGFIIPDFKEVLGEDANGVLSVMATDPAQAGELGERYQEQYGTFLPDEAKLNAAGLSVIAQALEAKPTTDPTELAETLRGGTFDEGIAGQMPGGEVSFDEAGNNTAIKPVMVQWQDGKLVGVWPPEDTSAEPRWVSPGGE